MLPTSFSSFRAACDRDCGVSSPRLGALGRGSSLTSWPASDAESPTMVLTSLCTPALRLRSLRPAPFTSARLGRPRLRVEARRSPATEPYECEFPRLRAESSSSENSVGACGVFKPCADGLIACAWRGEVREQKLRPTLEKRWLRASHTMTTALDVGGEKMMKNK